METNNNYNLISNLKQHLIYDLYTSLKISSTKLNSFKNKSMYDFYVKFHKVYQEENFSLKLNFPQITLKTNFFDYCYSTRYSIISLDITVSKSMVSFNDLFKVINELSNLSHLTINLSERRFNDSNFTHLMYLISQKKSLVSLNLLLKSNNLTLTNYTFCNLNLMVLQLDISSNNIQEQELRSLIFTIEQCSFLTNLGLGLSRLNINQETAKELSNMLIKHKALIYLQMDLTENNIMSNKVHFEKFISSISNIKSLRSLKIGLGNINFKFCYLSILRDNLVTLQSLDFLEFDITGNSSASTNFKYLFELISKLYRLTYLNLNLSYTRIIETDLCNLVKTIERHKSLIKLIINLNQNNLGDYGAGLLAPLAFISKLFPKLDLRNNNVCINTIDYLIKIFPKGYIMI